MTAALRLLCAGISPRAIGRLLRLRAWLRLHPELVTEQTPETARLLFGVWLVTSGRVNDR